MEIGSGIGEATAALAAARPDHDVLALEVWRPGVADSLWRIAEAGADNVRLCSVDAVWVLDHLVEPDGLAGAVDLLPRPLAQDPAPQATAGRPELRERWPRLGWPPGPPGGWPRTGPTTPSRCEAVLDAEPLLEGGLVPRWDERPVTRFERKGVEAGRNIIDLAYARRL